MNGFRWIVAAALAAVTLSCHALGSVAVIERQVAETARMFGGPYSIVRVVEARPSVVSGLIWNADTGVVMRSGDELPPGRYVNLGQDGAHIMVGDDLYPLESLETFGVVDEPDGPGAEAASNFKTCFVECDEGFYACCTYGSPPKCKCRPNADSYECDAGGPGSWYCSISQGKLHDIDADVPE